MFFDSLVSLPRPQVQPPPMPAQADDMDESEFASELDRTADLVRELVGKLPQLDEPLRMRCMSAVSILDQASDDLQHRGTSKSFFAKCVDLINVVLHADMLKNASKHRYRCRPMSLYIGTDVYTDVKARCPTSVPISTDVG